MKIAIIFFGLTRSLNKTYESLKNNILDVLTENNIQYDIFIHTYKIYGRYYNRWSGEKTENYINENVEDILNPKYYIYDDIDNIDKSINYNLYYKKLGNWSGMGSKMTMYLIRNMCLALYSKKKIMSIFEEHIDEYDYSIIIRPDLLIKNKLDINFFNLLNNNNVIIPEIDCFYGVNDRLCISKPNIALYIGNLFDHLLNYSRQKSIISEVYLIDKLNEKRISILKKNILYETIRINYK